MGPAGNRRDTNPDRRSFNQGSIVTPPNSRLDVGELVAGLAAMQCHQGHRHTQLPGLSLVGQCHLGYSVTVDTVWLVEQHSLTHLARAVRTRSCLCPFSRMENTFRIATSQNFLLHLMGQVTVCGHANTRAWPRAWNYMNCLVNLSASASGGKKGIPSPLQSTRQSRAL